VSSAAPATQDGTARRLVLGVAALLTVDLVGGVLAIANDVNTFGEAWSGDAALAARVWPSSGCSWG
jgi:hypothetical protein